MHPRVSIVMPVYNGTRYLETAFRKIADQTMRDFEVIVIDDGSSDESAAMAKQLLATHELAGTVESIRNRGPEAARDAAIAKATGEWIAPYDVDDQWHADYLKTMLQAAESSGAALVFSDFWDIAEHGGKVAKSEVSPWLKLSSAEQLADNLYRYDKRKLYPILLQGQVVFPPATVFNKAAYDEVGAYTAAHMDLKVSLDWDFALRMSREKAIAYVHKPLVDKFRHGDNASGDTLKTALCDIAVLEHVLKSVSLTNEEKTLAETRLATRLRDAGGSCHERGDMRQARELLGRSLRLSWHMPAFKYFVTTFPPFSLLFQKRQKA